VAQVVTFLMTPRNQRSALDLLSKNQADYSPWKFDLPLPPIAPEVPRVVAAELATATSAAQSGTPTPVIVGIAPTAELEFVPEVAGAPTPTFAGVNPPTSTPTPTPTSGGAIASGPTETLAATSAGASAPTDAATSPPAATPIPTNSNHPPTRT